MKKPIAWSYSSITSFETCPKQFYHEKILKEYPFVQTPAVKYGNEFHKAAEDFVRDGTPVPEQFAFTQGMLDNLAEREGVKHLELKMGLTIDLQPCGFFAKDVWFRGIVDYLSIDGGEARVVDYKTGKSAKYADPDQLELMALTVFKHYPLVTGVRAALLYVIAGKLIPAAYTRDDEKQWAKWIRRVNALQDAVTNDVWNPKPSGLCRAHCPVVTCAHNGANS
jgi:RecB family exonuclease